jgi:hypothetical protein
MHQLLLIKLLIALAVYKALPTSGKADIQIRQQNATLLPPVNLTCE